MNLKHLSIGFVTKFRTQLMNQQPTIDEQLAYIKELYINLAESERKDFSAVLASLVQLSKESHATKQNYLKEIKTYLNRKKQRESRPEITSIFTLKSLINKNKYDDEVHDYILSIIWDLLLNLSYFKDNKSFYNLIGYYLQLDLPKNQSLATKEAILDGYKQAFETLPKEEQQHRMQELAAAAFRIATSTELKKFNERFKP